MSQASSTGQNPRRRVPFSQQVKIRYPLFQDFIREAASNISLGGMFIESTSPLPVGSEFDFEIALDNGPSLIGGRGKVAWIRGSSDQEEGPAGMGVTFLQLGRDSLDLVRRIVDEQRAEGDEPFDLLEPAIADARPTERFSKNPGPGLGRRGSLLAYWFSVGALSVAVGAIMMFAFDHYYVQPRIEQLQRDAAVDGSTLERPTLGTKTAPATADVQAAAASAPVEPAAPATSDALEAVQAWAAAWEEQRVDDYVDSYAESFKPSGGRTRESWAAQRAERIGRQSNLRLDVTLAEVEASGPMERRVTFVQSYASDAYQDRVRKLMRLVWEDDRWRIAEEQVIRPSAGSN